MRQYTSQDLVVHPGNSSDPHVVVEVTPELAGWQYITFQVRQLPAGHTWSFATGQREMAIIVLSGRLGVESNRGQCYQLGQLESVFNPLPSALYHPRDARLTIFARSSCQDSLSMVPGH